MSEILITSSILILALAALRPLLRGRIDPRVQYALWLVAALRLLVPVNLFTSAYSALALLDKAERPAQVAQAIGQASLPVPAMSYEDAYILALQEYQRNTTVTTSFTDLDQVENRARELTERGLTLSELAAKYARPVWLGGAAAMAAWFGFVNLGLRRRLKSARQLNGVDCLLPVYVSDALPSPCLCGALRPRIYVTPTALESPDRLRHVLAHELAHHRHRDHWWALLRCACLCLYWFDPLVWWAAALSRRDCELACDAGAIRALGEEERIPYGRTLVDMIAAGHTSLLQTATTMTGGKRRVRERVRLIARRPKTVIAVALALALIVGCAVGCTFSGAPEKAKTLDNLQQRLEDIPEDLQGTVTAVMGNGSLVEYRLDVPANWVDEHYAYVLSVHSFQKEGFRGWPESGEDILWEIAAQDDTSYYAIHRLREQTYPSGYEYWDTHRAVRAFVEETLLATEGVEPYDSSQPPDTLQARLLDLPEDLDNVEAASEDGSLAVYYFKKPGVELDQAQYLLIVSQRSEEDFQRLYDESHYPVGGSRWFAKGSDRYYLLQWNSSIEYDLEDEEAFNAALRAVSNFAQKTVLETEGVEPYTPPQEAVLAVVNRLLAAPSITLSLAPAGSSRVYPYPIDPGQHPSSYYLSALAFNFRWEEAPWSMSEGADTLRIEASDGSASLTLKEGSYLVTDGDGNCWKGVCGTEDYLATADTTPFDYLRRLMFDVAELDVLRSTTVPNRDQSHEDIVREWAENWEGARTKTAPGSQYACTYVRIENVNANLPEFESRDALEEFVQNRNLAFTADDFGKIWFCFSYDTVFVPADQSEDGPMWAGNTRYYEGDGAPEGALVYSHVGYMWLTDEGWTCTGVGTGL